MPENSETPRTPKNPVYLSPTPGKITIAAFYPFVATSSPATAICKDLKDCGFTSAIINVRDSADKIALTTCALYGIHPFFHDPRLTQSENACKNLVSSYAPADSDGNHVPNTQLGGWMLTNDATPADVKKGSSLANAIGWIREYDPCHPIFTGVIANADFSILNGVAYNYKHYIEDLEYNLSPSLWPYRYFPYPGSPTTVSYPFSYFYKGLETFAFMARYTNVPMWSYVKALTRTGGTPPTEAQMRLEAFSALAYGAQGIAYWRYRPESDSEKGLVTSTGEKTDQWRHAQKINQEITTFNNVFAGAQLVECRHTKTQPAGTCMLQGAFGPLLGISSGNDGVLLSHICNEGKNYLIIVNHSATSSQRLTLNFSRYWRFFLVNGEYETQYVVPTDPIGEPFPVSATLPAGGYLIYRWE